MELSIPAQGDETKPAWAFCEGSVCAVHTATKTKKRTRREDAWLVPDGDGTLLVWGIDDPEALDARLESWRAFSPPADATDGTLRGSVDPDLLLKNWKPQNERSKELVERVTSLTGAVEFSMQSDDQKVDLTLKLLKNPGEPKFVASLGEARAPIPFTAGLLDDEVVGAIRISADPSRLWKLGRSVLSAPRRGELDEFLATLKEEAALDLEKVVVENMQGHILLVIYDIVGEPKTPADWLSLGATNEAVLIPLTQRRPVRRAFDAWTQLSKGRLHVRSADAERLQWAWIEEGELRWTAILGDDWLLFVDSQVSLDRARRWMAKPAELRSVLADRNVDELLNGTSRSGVYVDLARLRPMFGDQLDEIFPGLKTVTLVDYASDGGETIEVRATFGEP